MHDTQGRADRVYRLSSFSCKVESKKKSPRMCRNQHEITIEERIEKTISASRRLRPPSVRLVDAGGTPTALIKAVTCELIGTLLFVLLATGNVVSSCHLADIAAASGSAQDLSLMTVSAGDCSLQSTNALSGGLAFGFAIFVAVYITAPVSVSLGCVLTGKASLLRGVLYTIAQCLGSAIGSAVLQGIDPYGFRAANGAANALNPKTGVGASAAWGLETSLTFILVTTVFLSTDAGHTNCAPHSSVLAPFAIGMAVFVCVLLGAPIDGTSINPARSFGPAAVAHAWKDHWIFWVGPAVGALLAALVYELVFKSRESTYKDVGEKKDQAALPPELKSQPITADILLTTQSLHQSNGTGTGSAREGALDLRQPNSVLDSITIEDIRIGLPRVDPGNQRWGTPRPFQIAPTPDCRTSPSLASTVWPPNSVASWNCRTPHTVREWRRIVLHHGSPDYL